MGIFPELYYKIHAECSIEIGGCYILNHYDLLLIKTLIEYTRIAIHFIFLFVKIYSLCNWNSRQYR